MNVNSATPNPGSMPITHNSLSGNVNNTTSLTLVNVDYKCTENGFLQTPHGNFRINLKTAAMQQNVNPSELKLTDAQQMAIERLAKNIFEKIQSQPSLNTEISKVERISVRSSASDSTVQVKIAGQAAAHQLTDVADVNERMREIFSNTIHETKQAKTEDKIEPPPSKPKAVENQVPNKKPETIPKGSDQQVKISSPPISQPVTAFARKENVTTAHSAPRGICTRAGMTCFLNTALQLIAHFKHYNVDFKHKNRLFKEPDESEATFKIRQDAFIIGKTLILKISNGQNPNEQEVKEFLRLVGELNKIEEDNNPGIKALREGGDISLTLKWIYKIFGKRVKPDPMLREIHAEPGTNPFEQTRVQPAILDAAKNFNRFMIKNLPTGDEPSSMISRTPLPESVDIEGKKFVLETVIIGGAGHTYPYIRSDDGGFIKYNDMNGTPPTPQKFSNFQEVQEEVKRTGGWFSVYYVLANAPGNPPPNPAQVS